MNQAGHTDTKMEWQENGGRRMEAASPSQFHIGHSCVSPPSFTNTQLDLPKTNP
jgi:hypothetical protein